MQQQAQVVTRDILVTLDIILWLKGRVKIRKQVLGDVWVLEFDKKSSLNSELGLETVASQLKDLSWRQLPSLAVPARSQSGLPAMVQHLFYSLSSALNVSKWSRNNLTSLQWSIGRGVTKLCMCAQILGFFWCVFTKMRSIESINAFLLCYHWGGNYHTWE